MNKYEAKQEAQRERLLERAEKAKMEAMGAATARRALCSRIPLGQPILVGHHSEKRHRRDIERIDRQFQRQHKAHQKAERLEARAAGVGRGGVSADDPDAVQKLSEQLEILEEVRGNDKAANKVLMAAVRKAKKAVGEDGGVDYLVVVRELDIDEENRQRFLDNHKYFPRLVPKHNLANAGANLRRLKERIAVLRAEAQRPEVEAIKGEGYRIEEDRDDNRIRIFFDDKPSSDVRTMLKRYGFRWAPLVEAWQRQCQCQWYRGSGTSRAFVAGGSRYFKVIVMFQGIT